MSGNLISYITGGNIDSASFTYETRIKFPDLKNNSMPANTYSLWATPDYDVETSITQSHSSLIINYVTQSNYNTPSYDHKIDFQRYVFTESQGTMNNIPIDSSKFYLTYLKHQNTKIQSAFFEGTEQFFSLSADNSLDFKMGIQDFSIETWFKTGMTSTDNVGLIGKDSSSVDSKYGIYLEKDTNKLIARFVDNDSASGIANSNIVVNDDKWHHAIAFINRTSGNLDFYVDNVLTNTDISSATSNIDPDGAFLIGSCSFGTSLQFQGKIARSRIYKFGEGILGRTIRDTIVSSSYSDFINVVFNNASSQTSSYQPYVIADYDESDGLIGRWLNDGTLIDSSKNSNDGTLLSGAFEQTDMGYTVNFSASDAATLIDIGSGSDDILTDIFSGSIEDNDGATIMAWIYPRTHGASNAGVIFSKRTPSSNNGWQFHLDFTDGSFTRLFFARDYSNLNNQSWFRSTTTIPLNEWSHVAVTYKDRVTSGVDTYPTFYNNGLEMETGSFYVEALYALSDVTESLTIGNQTYQNSGFDGFIFDARIYDRVLSQQKIKGIATNTKKISSYPPYVIADYDFTKFEPIVANDNLIGRWLYDGTTLDSSKNSNDGTLLSGAFEQTDMGYTVNFSASDAATLIDIGSGSGDTLVNIFTGSVDTIDGATIMAWIYPRSAGSSDSGVIFSKRTPAFDNGWQLHTTNEQSGNVKLFFVRDYKNGQAWYTSQRLIPINEWSHIAVSYIDRILPGGSEEVKTYPTFYKDGIQIGTGSFNNSSITTTDFTESLTIGNHTAQSSGFDGFIFDARIYDKILTPEEILETATRVNNVYIDQSDTQLDLDNVGFPGFGEQNVESEIIGLIEKHQDTIVAHHTQAIEYASSSVQTIKPDWIMSSSLVFGQRIGVGPNTTASFLTASVHEMRIYGDALDKKALESHALDYRYIAGATTSSTKKLIAHWRMNEKYNTNEGETGSLKDSSPWFEKFNETASLFGFDQGTASWESNYETIYVENRGYTSDTLIDDKISIGEPQGQEFDNNKISLTISPYDQINKDIIDTLTFVNLNEYSVKPFQRYKSSYNGLNEFKDFYYEKFKSPVDIENIFKLSKEFNNTVFNFIEKILPIRATLERGVVIKNTLFDTNTISSRPGTINSNNTSEGSVTLYNQSARKEPILTGNLKPYIIAGSQTENKSLTVRENPNSVLGNIFLFHPATPTLKKAVGTDRIDYYGTGTGSDSASDGYTNYNWAKKYNTRTQLKYALYKGAHKESYIIDDRETSSAQGGILTVDPDINNQNLNFHRFEPGGDD